MTNLEKRIRKEARISIEALPEDTPPEGNCLASGDDAEDVRAAREIREQLENGNEWAWCVARVRGEWEGLRAEEYLGCCSYESAEDFKTSYFRVKKPGAKRFSRGTSYYDEMRETVLLSLVDQTQKIAMVR